MATKEAMRSSIVKLEPNNEVANRSSSGHAALKTELAAVKRRHQVKTASSAVQSILSYRLEDHDVMCWRLIDRSTGKAISELGYGNQLPLVNELITIDPESGMMGRVSSHKEDLTIIAGDLPIRELFDARRIYTTPNGTSVVYMRQERGKVVLWSYKIHAEIMISGKVSLERTKRKSQPVARKKRKMTQKLVAAYLIADNPDITGMQLTLALKDAFPSANITEDGRHGPHYLSLSRNGKLPMAPEEDPRSW